MPNGFSISHQKVSIDVDPQSRRIDGNTELTIIPLDPILKTLSFNARHIRIKRVTVNEKNAQFKYNDPSGARMAPMSTIYQHEMLRDKLDPAEDDTTLYELAVTVPKGVKPELYRDPNAQPIRIRLNRAASEVVSVAASPQPSTPAREGPLSIYEAMTVNIEFDGENVPGLTFVGAGDDPRYPHVYTTNAPMGRSTCTWVPCLDGLWNPCTWEINLTIPRTVLDIEKAASYIYMDGNGNNGTSQHEEDDDLELDEEDDGKFDLTAVCSGDFLDELPHPFNPHKKTVKYTLPAPTAAQFLAFAVGPFTRTNLSDFRETDEDDAMGSIAVDVVTFSLPRRESQVKNTCVFLYKAVDFFVREFGSYPFTSFKLCFVDDSAFDGLASASLAICSNRVLFPVEILDLVHTTTRTLTSSLAAQWSGVNIVPKTWNDIWVTTGIAGHMTNLFLRRLMGNNEYRYKFKEAADEVCRCDVGKLPIGRPGLRFPVDPAEFSFIQLKAPMVLFILDRRMSKGGVNLGLNRVISKLFLTSMSSGLIDSTLSTSYFQRTCEKVAHQKLETFFQQWVHGSGYPRFSVVQRFNKKKMIVELGIRQMQLNETTEPILSDETFLSDALPFLEGAQPRYGQQTFTGPMTIRIHEADGTPYEHVIELKEAFTRLDIPYNTKYRRLRRRGQRAKQRAAIDGDQETEEILLHCLGDVLQSEEEMSAWCLSEWTLDEEAKMNAEAFEWIRLDADFEWICKLTLNQPEYMFLSQLQQDRDVVAQYEAIEHFRELKESALISTIFIRTLCDERYYYGIRRRAAVALAGCATAELDWIGLFHLTKFFQEFFGFAQSSIPQANDFTDVAAYFVKCALPEALSRVRDARGRTPLSVRKMLLDLLRYNENSSNPYSDSFWVSVLIKQLARALVPTKPPSDYGYNFEFEDPEDTLLVRSALVEIERFQRMDRWIPSFGNEVTKAALEARCTLNTITAALDFRELLTYTRESNIETVRARAFQILIHEGALRNGPLTKYVFQSLRQTHSRYITRTLVDSLRRGIGALALRGRKDIKMATPVDDMIIEEDTTQSADARKAQMARASMKGAIDALREELDANELFQHELWTVLTSGTMDESATRELLDIARVAFEFRLSLLIKLRFAKNRPRLIARSVGPGKLVIRKQMPLAPAPAAKPPLKIKLKMGL